MRQIVRKFGSDRRGTIAVAGAVAAPVIGLAIGLCVDIAQLVHVRANLQNALDAAVTSTTRDLTTGRIKENEARAKVTAFLLANAGASLGENNTLTLDGLVVDRAAKTVTANASIDARMLFPVFGLANARRVGVNAAALYSDKKIEVAMMLDITGSMAGRKIEDLKKAANNAVDGLLDSVDPEEPRVRLAIVPYAAAVNVGLLANDDTVFPELSPSQVPKTVNPNLPPPLVSLASVKLNAMASAQRKDTCATERRLANGDADFSDDGPQTVRRNNVLNYDYLALVNRDDRLPASACPKPALVPLTADKAALKSTIARFKADGTTAGGIALQWGAYMLSPEWREAIQAAGLGAGPAPYNSRKTAKVAVLMTDGQFNTSFSVADTVPVGSLDEQYAESRDNALGVCGAMKANGIEVYTVGFALPAGESNAARKLLAACASPNNPVARQHFFDAANGEELDEAFQEIIANAERLAVTK